MGRYNFFARLTVFMFVPLVIFASVLSVQAQILLTAEEKEYVKQSPVLKAGSTYGAAPLQFLDKSGEVEGISKRVLDRISEITGLTFEYQLYHSVQEILASDSVLVFGIPMNYAPSYMLLSKPFLESETILYLNSAVEPDNLDEKVYAAVRGSSLPEGIKEEYSLYFNTREESIDAVNSGQADYGYGNAYSVAYYKLLKGYQNLVTVPHKKEARAYRMGILNDDETLLSIINKALNLISSNEIQTLVLDVASNVERELSLALVLEAYGREIFAVILVAMTVLLFSFATNLRVKQKLELQNKRYEVLMDISNQYLYEYDIERDELEFSEQCAQLFQTREAQEQAAGKIKEMLAHLTTGCPHQIIELALGDGKKAFFKTYTATIADHSGSPSRMIGKLLDVSLEVAEREELLVKSQIDGLTGLYNPETTKSLIVDLMEDRPDGQIDALIVFDCDDFKKINDTSGHLAGNEVLKILANVLKGTFRSTDIIGRIGGDEFAVYLTHVPSAEFVLEKCEQIYVMLPDKGVPTEVTLSIGVALVTHQGSYKELFRKADLALYEAKRRGKAQIVFYDDSLD